MNYPSQTTIIYLVFWLKNTSLIPNPFASDSGLEYSNNVICFFESDTIRLPNGTKKLSKYLIFTTSYVMGIISTFWGFSKAKKTAPLSVSIFTQIPVLLSYSLKYLQFAGISKIFINFGLADLMVVLLEYTSVSPFLERYIKTSFELETNVSTSTFEGSFSRY